MCRSLPERAALIYRRIVRSVSEPCSGQEQDSADALDRAQRTSPGFEFVTVAEGMNFTDTLAELRSGDSETRIQHGSGMHCRAKTIVVSTRENFREESILQQHVSQHIPASRFHCRISIAVTGDRTFCSYSRYPPFRPQYVRMGQRFALS